MLANSHMLSCDTSVSMFNFHLARPQENRPLERIGDDSI